jgi:hypothetical protein
MGVGSTDLGGLPTPLSSLWAFPFSVGPLEVLLGGYVLIFLLLKRLILRVGPSIHGCSFYTIERKHKLHPRVEIGLGMLHLDNGKLVWLVDL